MNNHFHVWLVLNIVFTPGHPGGAEQERSLSKAMNSAQSECTFKTPQSSLAGYSNTEITQHHACTKYMTLMEEEVQAGLGFFLGKAEHGSHSTAHHPLPKSVADGRCTGIIANIIHDNN